MSGRGLYRFLEGELIRIRNLHRRGYLSTKIAECINEERPQNRKCTARGIRAVLKRQEKRQIGIGQATKRGRHAILDEHATAFIDAAVDADKETSASELQKRLHSELNLDVSIKTISRFVHLPHIIQCSNLRIRR